MEMDDDRKKINRFLASQTFFVIDSSQSYMNTSLELVHRNVPQTSSVPDLNKSLYSLSVEAILKYCQLSYDLLPKGRVSIHLISCAKDSTYFVTKTDKLNQNYDYLSKCFETISTNHSHVNTNNSYQSKIFLIEAFKNVLNLSIETFKFSYCRIIFMTNIVEDNFVYDFKKKLSKILKAHNLKSNKCPIRKLEVLLINNHPIDSCLRLSDEKTSEVLSESLRFTFCSINANQLIDQMMFFAYKHFDLAITKIRNVSRKTDAGSKDTIIIHQADAYVNHRPIEFFENDWKIKSNELRWIEPMKKNRQLTTFSAHRLIVLEKDNPKLLEEGPKYMLKNSEEEITHFIQFHHGDYYIHRVEPLIIMTDIMPSLEDEINKYNFRYRTADFERIAKSVELKMSKKPNENHGIKLSLDLLKNKTIYWPLTFEHSALLKLKNSSKFLSLIAQKHLDEIESKEIIEMIQYFLRANSSRENGSLFNRRNDSKEIKSIICKEIRHALVSYNFNSEHQRILDYYDNLIRKTSKILKDCSI